MDIKLRQYMDCLLDYDRDPKKWCGFDDFYYPKLCEELLKDEEAAKQFFVECTDYEFDLAAATYEELADKFGVSFVKWLVNEASHRKLTDYGLGELETIQINADLLPPREHRN